MKTKKEKQPSRQRGRPRGLFSKYAESLDYAISPEITTSRGKADAARFIVIHQCFKKEDYPVVFGCTHAEILSGTKSLPGGTKTAFTEASRWVEAGNSQDEAREIILDARKRDVRFSDIRNHFRSLRLGERGSRWGLTRAIERAIMDYGKRFPKLTQDDVTTVMREMIEFYEAVEPVGSPVEASVSSSD